PVLFNERVAVNTSPLAIALPKSPRGLPPPNTTATSPAGITVPDGNVTLTASESRTEYPPMFSGSVERFINSMNSSWDEARVPSTLASPPGPSGGSVMNSFIPMADKTVKVTAFEMALPGFWTVIECEPAEDINAVGMSAHNSPALEKVVLTDVP